jgi:hypothetical protein
MMVDPIISTGERINNHCWSMNVVIQERQQNGESEIDNDETKITHMLA